MPDIWIEKAINSIQQTFDGHIDLNELISAVGSYWKGVERESGCRFYDLFVWPSDDLSFDEYIISVMRHLRENKVQPYLGDMLVDVCLKSFLSWNWVSAPNRDREILSILEYLAHAPPNDVDLTDAAHFPQRPSPEKVYDTLCSALAAHGSPDLQDPVTVKAFGSSAVRLFHFKYRHHSQQSETGTSGNVINFSPGQILLGTFSEELLKQQKDAPTRALIGPLLWCAVKYCHARKSNVGLMKIWQSVFMPKQEVEDLRKKYIGCNWTPERPIGPIYDLEKAVFDMCHAFEIDCRLLFQRNQSSTKEGFVDSDNVLDAFSGQRRFA